MQLSQNISLYDLLGMFVAGLLILYPFNNSQSSNPAECVIYFVLCYLIGIVYHKIVEYITSPLRNVTCMVEKGRKESANNFQIKTGTPVSEKTVDYYEAYYLLIKWNCLNVIPILEAQIVFIRNIYPLILLYVFLLAANCITYQIDLCTMMAFLSILVVSLPFIWYELQMKVY